MASITRWWQGSEPRGDQDTSSAYSPAACRCRCAWELHRFAAWHSGEETLLLITPLAWALLQTQIYVKPLNIFHHLLCFILNLLKNHLKLKDDASELQASYTGVCQGSSLSTHCTGCFRGVSLRFHGLRKALQSAEMGSVPLVGE